MKKIVMITGCFGFIGSHLTKKCLDLGWYVVGVDKLTYAANQQFIPAFNEYKNFKFIHADINDLDSLYDCDYIINTAAETHVDNSIAASALFLQSNVNGVHHLLELIKQKNKIKMPILLHFSTDEVYGDIAEGFHTENDLLRPSNPYSATKAAADMLILAWARTYSVPYVLVRPTNNYGIGQYVEKLIPKTIKYLTVDRKIDLHDKGTPVRTWLHVSDTVDAVMTIIAAGVTNEIYNISGNCEHANLVVVKKILALYDAATDYKDHIVELARQGQDIRYAIDDSKLKTLGWNSTADFDQELRQIVAYYKHNFIW